MFDSIKEILHLTEPKLKKQEEPDDLEIEHFSVHILLKVKVKVNEMAKILTFKLDEIELQIEEVLDENNIIRKISKEQALL